MKRVSDELLTGYIHRALSNDEMAQVELALRTDDDVRQRVQILRQLQNDIKRGIFGRN